MRTALADNDDSLMYGKDFLKARTGDYTYSLLDSCATIDDKKKAASCRTEQKCTAPGGKEGVNLDVVLGGAGDTSRSSRGTQMCIANADAAKADDNGYVPMPVFTLADFKRLNVAPAVLEIDPSPDTLKNMNTNMFAQANAQTFTTDLGGYPVAVRAYPAQYTYTYGDGTSLGPTPLAGAPLEDGAWDVPTDTSHVYTRTGDYTVAVTTYYYGEYNIAGTGWQPVDGFNDVTSAPQTLSVWRSTVRNVADNCLQNPSSPGCPGTGRH